MSVKPEKSHHKNRFFDYLPLVIVIVIAALSAYALEKPMGIFSWRNWMGNFMGLFFVQLAAFKFFDLRGFAHGFATYDLPTHYFKPYAYIYPFIELLLGLLYLSHFMPVLTNLLTIIVMAVGIVGVVQGMMKRRAAVCACMGTVLKVPLSVVSIVEYLGMGIMAILLII